MPLPVQSLSKESTDPAVRDAISASIKKCMQEGKSQKECAAIAYQYARELTGKELQEGRA